MTNFKIWLKAIRIPFFTATLIPVTLGSIVAWHETSNFYWIKFFLALSGALFLHAGVNLANDYFDHLSGCDEKNPTPTPFSGGSRVIQQGLIIPRTVLFASLLFFTFGSAVGLYLNYVSFGNTVLILGIIGVFLGFFYTAGPLRIGYGTFGELTVGIVFGPLMVIGAYYVQAQELPFKIFLISVPAGILIALVLLINEFPDYLADKSVNKRTLVVALGKKKAIVLYQALLAAVYLFVVLAVIFKFLPSISLIVFFSLPLALKAFAVSKNNFHRIYELLPVNAFTIRLHSLNGFLLCAAFVLDKIFRTS